MRLPRFHTLGDDDGHFYALAYVIGSYVPPSARSKDDAFFVLDFSPSKGFTRFSFSTISPKGDLFHYTRGVDELDTLDYAFLRASAEERVPMHAWRLFPSTAIEENTFGADKKARDAYEAARKRLALMLYRARTHVWATKEFPTEPLFRPNEADYPELMVDTPESQEISRYVSQLVH